MDEMAYTGSVNGRAVDLKGVVMTVALDALLADSRLALRLVAGSATGVELEWAHAIDLLDPSPWLNGGELVLTTGLRLPRARSEQRAYVDRIAAGRAAGIAFGVGIRFTEVPSGVVERCGELGMPLIEVPLPTPFIAITQAVAQRLADQRERELQRTVRAQQELTRVTLRDGLAGLAARLSAELGASVVVLDEYASVVAGSDGSEALAELVRSLVREPAQEDRTRTAPPPDPSIEVQALAGRTARRGWLAVQHPNGPDPSTRVLLNHAVSVATLHFDRPREVEDARIGIGSTVLALILDRAGAEPSVTAHLRRFGFDADDLVRVVSVARAATPALETAVQAQLSSPGFPHVMTRGEADVLLLVRSDQAARAIERIEAALAAVDDVRSTIGVSGPLAPEHAASGLVPARRAARAARLEGRRVGWFDSLTLEQLLVEPTVRAHVAAMARSTIEPLLADAAVKDQNLLATLGAYLEHNGSWETAARALGVHRHTLRNRVTRIERLTGLSLDVAANRVVLTLALATLDPP